VRGRRPCGGARAEGPLSGWSIAKYALALAGIALVLAGERAGASWLGYLGLALLALAFMLRFPQRRAMRRDQDGEP